MDNIKEPVKRRSKKNESLIILGMNFFVMMITILCMSLYLIFEIDSYILIPYISALFIIQMAWIIYSNYKCFNSLLNPFTLFLFALILFNGGQIIIQGFSFSNIIIYGGSRYDEILESILFISLSIQIFNMGGLLGSFGVRNNSGEMISTRINQNDNRRVGWFFIIVAFVPYLITSKEAISVVLRGGYFSLYEQVGKTGVSASVEIVSNFIIPGFLFLLAGSKNNKFGKYSSLFFLITNTSIQFILGSRSSAIMPVIAYIWLWDVCIKRISRKHLYFWMLVVLIIIFPVVGIVRGYVGVDKFSIQYLYNVFSSIENPVFMILSEMGNTFRTVFYTMILVPSSRPFDLGASYAYSLLAVFPNLFWDIHPIVSRGLLGSWVTRTAYGSEYKWGFGFSAIAEAYLNFGWFFGALFMGLLGYLLMKFLNWSNNGSVYSRKAFIATFMSFGLFFARGESAGLIRYLIWYGATPYICIYFFKDIVKGIK